jgi:hypothetical protein
MGVNYFTPEQVEELRRNPYVRNVSEKALTYTESLKEDFITQYGTTKTSTVASFFEQHGFNPQVLGASRMKSFSKLTRRQATRSEGFKDQRALSSGRPRKTERTAEQELAYLKHKIALLEQENDFLKKIDFIERRALWQTKQPPKKNSSSSKT